ncbi:MAG: shikimate dehydrogenase [archaeon]|nr:shikimate dehydrogenase [archaeon]
MIDSKTKLVCLLGKPAKHSLSPAMQNAGFNALGLNFVYLAFEPENLKKTVDGLKEMGVAGFNVTMPFKAEIMKHLDRIDPIAKQIGAVNTVVNTGKDLVGYNTDGVGAIESLKKVTSLRGKRVLLIGAGGAGKAIGFYLKNEGAKITIANKPELQAIKLAKILDETSIYLDSINSLEEFDILINATPAGMKPDTEATAIPTSLLKKELVVFDIVYEPMETKLLKEAKKKGCRTINGLEMLLNQGYAGFKLFTGQEAPREEMREAIMKELKK